MRKEKNKLPQPGNQIIYRGKMSGMAITRDEQILFESIREKVRNDTFLSPGYRTKIIYDEEQFIIENNS